MNPPAKNLAVSVLLISLAIVAAAQTTDEKPAVPKEASVGESLKLELFQGPRVKEVPKLQYPPGLMAKSSEGWVNVSMMVDTEGKPYETMVTNSVGDKAFERDAIEQMANLKFEPATQDGKPVDSSFEFKVRYTLKGGENAARSQFADDYRKLMAAVNTGDKAKADTAMSKLRVDNLYEDAYFGFAQYHYAKKWGTEQQQLLGLTRAIAHESKDSYLPKQTFVAALAAILPLEVRARDFAAALDTWRTLQSMNADEKVLTYFKPYIDQVNALHDDASAFSVEGELIDGSWYFKLFKRKFAVEVSNGKVSEVKLRCYSKFVFFPFDPKLVYTVSDKYGKCSLQLIGDPGTKIKLIQS